MKTNQISIDMNFHTNTVSIESHQQRGLKHAVCHSGRIDINFNIMSKERARLILEFVCVRMLENV